MSYEFKKDDVLEFAYSMGHETHRKGDELFFKWCPYCRGSGKDKDTFSVNLNTGAFKCFRSSCDRHGHFVELARDFDFKLEFDQPKVYKKLPQKEIKSKVAAVEFMASRGIGEETCKRYKITVQKNNPAIIVFPFYDERGVLQFVKYRNSKFNGKGNKEWCEKDTMPIPFGMAQCVDFTTLVITEGQMDSLSVAECGVKNAVSVPTGATGFTWLANCWDWISRFEEVVVFGDCEKGKITLADTLRARLKQTVRVVRKQDYLGEKDANDILRKYGKQAILTAIANAETPRIENVKDLALVESVDLNNLPCIKTNILEIDRLIGGLVMGQVILLTGKRGNGKSTFMSQLVCEAIEQGEPVFVYSGELADYHFKRWLDYQLAGQNHITQRLNEFGDYEYTINDETIQKISDWYRGRAYIYDNDYIPDGEDEMESLTGTIEKVIRQYGVRLICIDNLMTAMEAINEQNQLYLAQSQFVGRLKKIAKKYDVAIVLVAHPRKSKENFDNDDVSGSADITNRVDVVMSYQRVENEDYDARLLITKNRLFGRYANGDNAIKMWYSPSSKRIFTNDDNRHYGWENGFDGEEELPL